ncbi:MAG: tetratricopeptide repeat protein [Anaerolineaceae bacterium]|nr:tetratricopeptide repeat protein [Anaerolineaceae bacterium]
MKTDSSFLTSWRFIVLLIVAGIIIRVAVPAINGVTLIFLFFVVLLLVFRKTLIRAYTERIGSRRTNTFLFSEEYEKAVEFATEQIAKNPKDVVAHLTRSTAYIHLGNLEAARADCESAIALDPKSVYTLNNRAVIWLQQDNLSAALADMQQAISLQPDNPVLLYGRGMVHLRMGNDEAAQKDFDQAIELEPDQAATYVGRGHLEFKQGDVGAALDDYLKAWNLSPETHQFCAALAVAEFTAGEVEAAHKRWQALPTRYSRYADPDWQRRVLNWPDVMTIEASKLVAGLSLPAESS